MQEITFEDFKKIEIKIGEIIEVSPVPDSQKLLKLTFDFGDEKRTILSGIAKYFEDPQVLVGKKIPVITNIKPRKMMGMESQGMIMAISDVLEDGSDGGVVLLSPERDVANGSLVL